MAQILDKQGLQHYANKMCNADNRKVGSKSLPTTLNEIDTAIDGFKTLFETEYGTPVNMELENNENVFSIGTGTNINKKDDVENSFTDLKIGGNTLVNLMPKITSGDYIQLNATTNWVTSPYYCTGKSLKPNTKYTVILDVHANSLSSTNNFHVNIDHNNAMAFTENWAVNSLGRHVKLFTTKAELLDNMLAPRTQIQVAEEGKYVRYSIVLLEGDWTNKPIPQYFEGLKSIGEKEDGNHKIEILSQNKNLFNYEEYYKYCPSTKTDNKTILSHSGDLRPGNHDIFFSSPMKVTLKPNTTYTFCLFNLKDSKQVLNCEGCLSTAKSELRLKVEIGQIGYKVFTTNSINYKDGVSFKINTSAGEKARYKIMIIEGNIMPSDYIHYDSNKKEILLNEPLRGLPNGVKDTIEKVNGEWKIVRRCGEIIFDGVTNRITDYHPSWSSGDYHAGYSNALKNIRKKGDTIGIADKIVVTTVEKILAGTNIAQNKGLWLENYSYVVYFSIPKNEATGESISAINTWLTNNNVKLIYQLKTPIIEDISPVTLQCWKNGTISIDEVLPVESTHTVALNKSAQIQKNIEELTVLRNRVKALEKQYDNSTLNQAYELELLRLDMQLDNII